MTVVERRWRRRLVARDRAALEAMRPIVREPDAPFVPGAGRVLQHALAQQVARFELAGHDLVLKRYQARGLGTRVRRLVTPSRAARSWRGAQRLAALGVNTPRPWLLIEERYGPLRGPAYLVLDYCPGLAVDEAYQQGDPAEREAIERALGRLFRILRRHRISHRDTKPENLLWRDGELWVLDLDSIRYHPTHRGAAFGSRRDQRVFLAGWRGDPRLAGRIARFIVTD